MAPVSRPTQEEEKPSSRGEPLKELKVGDRHLHAIGQEVQQTLARFASTSRGRLLSNRQVIFGGFAGAIVGLIGCTLVVYLLVGLVAALGVKNPADQMEVKRIAQSCVWLSFPSALGANFAIKAGAGPILDFSGSARAVSPWLFSLALAAGIFSGYVGASRQARKDLAGCIQAGLAAGPWFALFSAIASQFVSYTERAEGPLGLGAGIAFKPTFFSVFLGGLAFGLVGGALGGAIFAHPNWATLRKAWQETELPSVWRAGWQALLALAALGIVFLTIVIAGSLILFNALDANVKDEFQLTSAGLFIVAFGGELTLNSLAYGHGLPVSLSGILGEFGGTPVSLSLWSWRPEELLGEPGVRSYRWFSWALAGLVVLFLTHISWFLVRDFKRRGKTLSSQEVAAFAWTYGIGLGFLVWLGQIYLSFPELSFTIGSQPLLAIGAGGLLSWAILRLSLWQASQVEGDIQRVSHPPIIWIGVIIILFAFGGWFVTAKSEGGFLYKRIFPKSAPQAARIEEEIPETPRENWLIQKPEPSNRSPESQTPQEPPVGSGGENEENLVYLSGLWRGEATTFQGTRTYSFELRINRDQGEITWRNPETDSQATELLDVYYPRENSAVLIGKAYNPWPKGWFLDRIEVSFRGDNIEGRYTNIDNPSQGGYLEGQRVRMQIPTDSEILPGARTRYYGQDELEKMTNEELCLLRNEFYVHHGYTFSEQSHQHLRDFFESKPWYYSRPNFGRREVPFSEFSRVERRNILTIQSIEKARGSWHITHRGSPPFNDLAIWRESR